MAALKTDNIFFNIIKIKYFKKVKRNAAVYLFPWQMKFIVVISLGYLNLMHL